MPRCRCGAMAGRAQANRSPPARAGGTAGDQPSQPPAASAIVHNQKPQHASTPLRTPTLRPPPGGPSVTDPRGCRMKRPRIGRVGGGRGVAIRSWAAQRPAVGGFQRLVGGDRGLGGLVVDAGWQSGVGRPNGPPSPRLAPGGFYAVWCSVCTKCHGVARLTLRGELLFCPVSRAVTFRVRCSRAPTTCLCHPGGFRCLSLPQPRPERCSKTSVGRRFWNSPTAVEEVCRG